MTELVRAKEVDVNGKKYTIPFPKVRHQLEIQSRRHLLSGGTYGQQERSNSAEADFNLNLIDALAHIQVLCPQILVDILGSKPNDVPDVYEMDLDKTKWIVAAYDQFVDWYLDIKVEVNSEMLKGRKERDKAAASKSANS